MAKFKPVKLMRGDEFRTAETAAQETDLRFEGWRTAPSEEPTPTPVESTETSTTAPKPGAKPAPKN